MTAFYNEPDPYAAQWLENLIAAGHIAPGIVDRRPIQQIEAWELAGFTQCHFFAGIGVWSYALRRVGWSDDRPIWTGSCPCQPFSAAGQQKGFDDARHLWPNWFDLIRECRPPTIVGEQVASALDWLDLVSTDLEAESYTFGASDLCAAGFGGAHIRQRLYFVAHTDDAGSQGRDRMSECADQRAAGADGVARGMADTDEQGSGRWGVCGPGEGYPTRDGVARERSAGLCATSRMADAGCAVLQSGIKSGNDTGTARSSQGEARQLEWGGVGDSDGSTDGNTHAPMLGRNPADWLYCRDGKWRAVEPGTFPLVDAAPARVGRLRAYGNALDAETATQFCEVVREICDDLRPVTEFDL